MLVSACLLTLQTKSGSLDPSPLVARQQLHLLHAECGLELVNYSSDVRRLLAEVELRILDSVSSQPGKSCLKISPRMCFADGRGVRNGAT